MPIAPAWRGGSGGGGGVLGLGPAQNTFGDSTTANRAAAETLRNTYAGANADWLSEYSDNLSLWIRLVWNGGVVEQRRNSAGNGWEDVTNVIRGQVGAAGMPGGGINWTVPDSETTADLASATASASAVDLGYDVTSTQDFIIAVQFESSGADTEDTGALSYVDASRLSTTNSHTTPLGQNDTLHLRIDGSDNLLGWRTGGDAGTYRIRIWEVVAAGSLGMSGPLTSAQVQSLIEATSLSALQGQVSDGQIPAAIMRDAEFTAAAVRNLLSLSSTEVNDLLTGASITNNVLTFTQNDGSTVPIALPAGGGGVADGVVASGAFNSANTELVLTLDTGGTVTIDVPAALRAGAGAADGTLLFATGAPANTLGSDGDAYLNTMNGAFYKKSAGAWTLQYTDMSGGVTPPGDHTRRGAISEDETLTAGEVTAGTSSTTQSVTMPTWTTGRRFLYTGVPTSEDDITGISTGGIDVFHAWEAVTGEVSGHKWWKTINSQSNLASGAVYVITEG